MLRCQAVLLTDYKNHPCNASQEAMCDGCLVCEYIEDFYCRPLCKGPAETCYVNNVTVVVATCRYASVHIMPSNQGLHNLNPRLRVGIMRKVLS